LGLIRQIEFKLQKIQNGNYQIKEDLMQMMMISLSNIVEASGDLIKSNYNIEAMVVHQNVFEKIGQYIQKRGQLDIKTLQSVSFMAESLEILLDKNLEIGIYGNSYSLI